MNADDTKCPKCGAQTYTWGDPLPGQTKPLLGGFDARERTHRSCVKCQWTTNRRSKTEATHVSPNNCLHMYYGLGGVTHDAPTHWMPLPSLPEMKL
jgi:predicted nucleic-acid-binding Zn-ribbon protein